MTVEWTAPAIVLQARPFNETDVVAVVLTEARGLHRGLVRGGCSRRQAALWQPGNLIHAHWRARLSEQLGQMTGELVHPTAAIAMDDPLLLLCLQSACAVAEAALPDREAAPRVFAGLLAWLATLGQGHPVPGLVRWELTLLAALGYGLDLSRCAVTGAKDDLAWVSPRTGRAVTDAAAEGWRERLLALPRFILDRTGYDGGITKQDMCDGLNLAGHFLARDAFEARHGVMPCPRQNLQNKFTN